MKVMQEDFACLHHAKFEKPDHFLFCLVFEDKFEVSMTLKFISLLKYYTLYACQSFQLSKNNSEG